MKQIKRRQPKNIKTHQSLVHIKHNITALQYKYWYLLLSEYSELFKSSEPKDENGFYEVSIKSISERLGYNPKLSELKKDLLNLRQQPIAINYFEKDGGNTYHEMGFISEFKVSATKIKFLLPTFVIDVLEEKNEDFKNMFLLMNWQIFNSFSGKYEAIIYKLCKDYIGVGRTPYMTIEEYREYIGLADIEYPSFRDLNKRCIKMPVKSINESDLSDILVDFEISRKGKKAVGLHFTVESKKQMTLQLDDVKPHPAFDFAKISITPDEQIQYLESYKPEQVKVIIDRANEYTEDIRKKGKKTNVGAIYKKAFSEGWGLDNAEYQKQIKAEQKAKKQEAEELAQREAEAKQQKAEAEEKERQQTIDFFNGLSEEIRKKIINDVLETCPSATRKLLKAAYEKHGLDVVAKSTPFRAEYVRMMNNQNQ